MSETEPEITVFYDGACPSCVRDRRHYEKWAGQAGASVCWFDITGQEERLRALGIDPHQALTQLHVMDENQRIRSELEAYILLLGKDSLVETAGLARRPALDPAMAGAPLSSEGRPSAATERAAGMRNRRNIR